MEKNNKKRDASFSKEDGYELQLMDAIVEYAMKCEEEYIWTFKNYEEDIQSDMLVQGFDSFVHMLEVAYIDKLERLDSVSTCLPKALVNGLH
ncbi:hypothetical protein V6N13_089482 [Hibiscus sabdariffa]